LQQRKKDADLFEALVAFNERFSKLQDTLGSAMRSVRNLAAHSYETDYAVIAEHFNTLHALLPVLFKTTQLFVSHCQIRLDIAPTHDDFDREFFLITQPCQA